MNDLSTKDLIKKIVLNELGEDITNKFQWKFSESFRTDSWGVEYFVNVNWVTTELGESQLEKIAQFANKYGYPFYPNHERSPGMEFQLSREIIKKITFKIDYTIAIISDVIVDIAKEEQSVKGVPDSDFFRDIEELNPYWSGKECNLF